MQEEATGKPDYEFSVKSAKGTCTCSCPCNPSNPIDVTVVVSAGDKMEEAFTIGPENVRKLG